MSNVKQRRLIQATEAQWAELNKIMFEMGVACPPNPFDMKIFANSEKGLLFLNPTSVTKIDDPDKRVEMVYHLLQSLGCTIVSGSEFVFKNAQSVKNFEKMLKRVHEKVNVPALTDVVVKE